MAQVKFIRKGKLPIRRLKIFINNNSFSLKGNENKVIDLPQGEYSLIMKMDWWKSENKINVDSEGNAISIKHYFPDSFYIIGIVVLVFLAIVTFFSILNIIYFTIWLFIFTITQLYFYFTKKSKYFTFKIIVNRLKSQIGILYI